MTQESAIPLRNATLAQLSAMLCPVPAYDRSRVASKLVHFGVGGFNRSHLAVYLDDLLGMGEEGGWGELGVGLLAADKTMHDGLAEQDDLYGLLLQDNHEVSYRVIGSLTGHLYAPASPGAVLRHLTADECAIVSLTVTEGGYFMEDATGRFADDHPDLRHDLEHPAAPRTWLGHVAAACDSRMRSGGAPFTLLSCDNVHANGSTARAALLAFAELRGPALRRWIETNVAFPCSMVDRITPRTTDENRQWIREKFGVLDQVPVVAEPFRQWIVEDTFAQGRPQFERAGAQMTSDVAPYELMKMRLLNGGHSTLGYAADLLGYASIADAMADPLLHDLLEEFLAEVRPTVPPVPGVPLEEYTRAILSRFANQAIHDQVSRICSEGCAKLAKFVVPAWRDLLASGGKARMPAFVIASWLRYLQGTDEAGRPMTMADQGLPALGPFLASGGTDVRLALGVRSIFGTLATDHEEIVSTVQSDLHALRALGVRAALTGALAAARA